MARLERAGGSRRTRIIKELHASMPVTLSNLEGGSAGGIVRTDGATGAVELAVVADNSLIGKTSGLAQEVAGLAIGADSLISRAGSADLAALAASDNSALIKPGLSALGFALAGANTVLSKLGVSDLGFNSSAANRIFGRLSSGDLGFQQAKDLLEDLFSSELAGAAFPTTELWDGRPFCRTDLHQQFFYDSGVGGWFGTDVLALHGGESVAESAYFDIIPFNAAYNANTRGWDYPFDVKPVWMSGRILGTSTCTVVIRSNGTNVTSAVLTWAAEAGKKHLELVGGTISAGDNIAFAVDTGTANTGGPPIMIHAGFRRFET